MSVALRRVSCGDVDGAPSWCVASLPRLAEPDDDIAGRVDWNADTRRWYFATPKIPETEFFRLGNPGP